MDARGKLEIMFIDWERGLDFNMMDVDFQDTDKLKAALAEIEIKSPWLYQHIVIMSKSVMEIVNDTKN